MQIGGAGNVSALGDSRVPRGSASGRDVTIELRPDGAWRPWRQAEPAGKARESGTPSRLMWGCALLCSFDQQRRQVACGVTACWNEDADNCVKWHCATGSTVMHMQPGSCNKCHQIKVLVRDIEVMGHMCLELVRAGTEDMYI